MRNWCVAETVCVRVEESGKAVEDAVDSGAGSGFVGIGRGVGGGLESSWWVERLAERGEGGG
jgi:hypothetical protein